MLPSLLPLLLLSLQEHTVAFQVQSTPQPLPPLPGTTLAGAGGAPIGSAGGWVWAAAILMAVRLGRVGAQEARMDVRQLQVTLLL